MTGQPGPLADAVRRPLPLAYHPLYRFYEGGSLTRAFRGLPERPDDWWSEDWVGSCTCAEVSQGRFECASPLGWGTPEHSVGGDAPPTPPLTKHM